MQCTNSSLRMEQHGCTQTSAYEIRVCMRGGNLCISQHRLLGVTVQINTMFGSECHLSVVSTATPNYAEKQGCRVRAQSCFVCLRPPSRPLLPAYSNISRRAGPASSSGILYLCLSVGRYNSVLVCAIRGCLRHEGDVARYCAARAIAVALGMKETFCALL